MMPESKIHWPSILILTALALSVFVLLGTSLAFGIASVIGLFNDSADPAGNMIKSFASGLEILLLAICAWFIFQKTTQKKQAEESVRMPYSPWQLFAVPAVVSICIMIGAAITISVTRWLGWWMLPILTLLTIALPIILILGIGTHGFDFGPRWKTWSTLALSMTVSPLVIIVLEIFTLVFMVITVGILLSKQPEIMQELGEISRQINQGVSEQATVELLSPYITKPATLASIFLYLSLIVPLIEEMIKPLAVWFFAGRLNTPANGFALGMLSGGAFALIESMNVSGNGSAAWFVIVSVRAGTSLLHMTTSGLMGFAIVQLVQERKVVHFIATYLAVATLHGIWNACAAGTALATIGEYVGRPEWLLNLPAALCGIAVLATGMFAVLIAANRKVRPTTTSMAAYDLVANEEGVK